MFYRLRSYILLLVVDRHVVGLGILLGGRGQFRGNFRPQIQELLLLLDKSLGKWVRFLTRWCGLLLNLVIFHAEFTRFS